MMSRHVVSSRCLRQRAQASRRKEGKGLQHFSAFVREMQVMSSDAAADSGTPLRYAIQDTVRDPHRTSTQKPDTAERQKRDNGKCYEHFVQTHCTGVLRVVW